MIAIDHRLARILEPAVLDHRDLEGRAAHIGGDDVAVAEHVGEMLRTNDTGGRSAFEHADRAARRLHQWERDRRSPA